MYIKKDWKEIYQNAHRAGGGVRWGEGWEKKLHTHTEFLHVERNTYLTSTFEFSTINSYCFYN